MTRKLLAVLLAVILAFSVGAVAFAEDGEGEETTTVTLTDEPAQEEGLIYLSAKSVWVEPDSVASVPVSIISDYTPTEVEGGIVFVGFTVSISNGSEFSAVTGFDFSDEIKDACIPELTFATDLSETFSVAIAVPVEKINLLKQERLELGTAEVTITDGFPGGEQPIDVVITPVCVCNDYLNYVEDYESGDYAGVMAAWNDGVIIYNDGAFETPKANETVFPISGHCYQEPPVEPWQDRLVDILKDWAKKLIDAFIAILEALEGLLEMI